MNPANRNGELVTVRTVKLSRATKHLSACNFAMNTSWSFLRAVRHDRLATKSPRPAPHLPRRDRPGFEMSRVRPSQGQDQSRPGRGERKVDGHELEQDDHGRAQLRDLRRRVVRADSAET